MAFKTPSDLPESSTEHQAIIARCLIAFEGAEMSKTSFKIGDGGANPEAVHQCIDDLDVAKVWRVTIEEWKNNRSGAQNALYWRWLTEYGHETGHSKEEAHEVMKYKFAVPIFVRDDAEYADMVASVKEVRKAGMYVYANNLRDQIVKLTSTTDFNVKQMAEYLTAFERFARSEGVDLSRPDDLMYEAGHK